MEIDKNKIKEYMKIPPKEKLRFLLQYKIFIEKTTGNTEKKMLIFLKRKKIDYSSDSPGFITNSE